MKHSTAAIAFLFLLLQGPLFAADSTLIYFENQSRTLKVTHADGMVLTGADLVFGMSLPAGSTVSTGKGDSLELKLPNGSIIKISEVTTFTLVSFQSREGSRENRFSLGAGKFRAVAARGAGGTYVFQTKTASCGVKGTDFGMEVPVDPGSGSPLPARAFVFEGLVEMMKLDDAGEAAATLLLAAGQWADAGAAVFSALVMDAAVLKEFRKGLEFMKADPKTVPGRTDTTAETGTAETAPETVTQAPPEPEWLKALRNFIGLEIGTMTIGDDTYAKAVLSPKITLDKLRLSFYLPLIYRTNLFDPGDWYAPDGNHEWSFGTDAAFGDNWWLRLGDIAYDLVLKIKSLEIGERRDPFFLKVGNLHDLSIGTGTLMRGYANDADFPAVRRIGLNLGVDTGGFGFELVSNDLGTAMKGRPEIAGTRLFFRPFRPFDLAFGIAFLADFSPADGDAADGDPLFLNAGLDVELPLLADRGLSLTAGGGFALMLPYFRSDVAGSPVIPAGFAFDAVSYGPEGDKSFSNWGAAAGLSGNISLFAWRLELRSSMGKFRPGLFDASYDRTRRNSVNELINYLRTPNDPANRAVTLGIYGEGGFAIEKIFSVTLGYLCPIAFSGTQTAYGEDDFLKIKLSLEPRVIPVVGIYGAISYERTGFAASLAGGLPALFDENTVVRVTLGWPVIEGLSILFHYTTAMAADPVTGVSSLKPSFAFETVMGF